MTRESEKRVREVAEEYLSALENGVDREKLDATEQEVEELRVRYERFVDKYGESDPATEELHDRLGDADQRMEDLEAEHRLSEELADELLQRATAFMLDDEWRQPPVLEALNRAFIGERSDALVIEEREITTETSVSDIDDAIRFDIIDIVRQLALDKLGEPSDVRDWWDTLKGTTKEQPFRIVAERNGAAPNDVLERLDDEELTREAVRGRLKNATQKDVNPYVRRDGVYHLSTVGEYLSIEYAGVTAVPAEEESEADSESGDGQATLDQTPSPAGGDSDE